MSTDRIDGDANSPIDDVSSRARQQLESGNAYYQSGKFEQAASCFEAVIREAPEIAQAWYLLGCISSRNQHYDTAIEQLSKAIELEPTNTQAYMRLGRSYYATRRIHEAMSTFRAVLQRDANNAAACNSLGACHMANNDVEHALVCFRQATELQPQFVNAHNNLGTLYQQLGELDKAVECFETAIRLQPGSAAAYHHLGAAHAKRGQIDTAMACFQRAIELKPDYASAYYNLGCVLNTRGELAEAARCFYRVIAIEPRHADAYSNLGYVCRAQGNSMDARSFFQKAIELQPDCLAAYNNLGLLLQQHGRSDEALHCYDRALQLKPDFEEAIHNRLLCLHYGENFEPQQVYKEHVEWPDRVRQFTNFSGPSYGVDADPNRRLRIGYVSGDLKCHSVSFFFEPLLACHDQSTFESICYSNSEYADETTERLRRLASGWRTISTLSDAHAAALIREDRVDILVDLSGHTSGNRLMVFAQAPAPIQATFLGYPNTTGMRSIQYRLTDQWADPPGRSDALHTEELIRLPHGFLCYQPFADCPPVDPPPILRRGFVTFGCFNNPAKLNRGHVQCWSKLLNSIPGSRLILKGEPFSDSSTRAFFMDLFAAHGVEPARVDVQPRTPGMRDHLAAYSQVDIALDTFPYHGTTTTCEALWMGVPVVTLAGEAHVSRVGVSLLTAVGLEELIAESKSAYVEKAIALAVDRDRLQRLRGETRSRMESSRVTNARLITSSIQDAYRTIWRKWCLAQNSPSAQI